MSHLADACPCGPRTGTVFALLGKRWNGQIVDLLLQGPARFGHLVAALPGLSHRVLTERLTELQDAGLVTRTDGHYTLTAHGEGLRPAIDALATWSQAPPSASPADGSCFAPDDHAVWEAFSHAGDRVRDTLERRVQDSSGMPPSYFELLRRLRHAPGRQLRMSELAALTGSKPSRITHAVNRLERAGWITRDGHPTDGRGSTATLTDLGVDAMEIARPEFTRVVREHVIGPLTPAEQDQLRLLCEKILASFSAHADDSSTG
ncbi:winged helix-turn-helix transcriptional regulator [Actinophytocola oryzae]|uniref:HxlR family transcriptional regulator n=1 Tax=Actinophytocola oryzae TaxID=502181 RepID=A0A4R7W0M9_9PSEU|nr:winged helix-turn-helix transcriptional regulator [Actinophytocola oryzae]TDV55942.1 HxlR family transcriptional regulator [Actinophytocola oryzae]